MMRKPPDPTRTTYIVDPINGNTTKLIDYRGCQKLPPRPTLLECDYCTQAVDKLWCRRTRAFSVHLPNGAFAYDGGTWNACKDCRPFVDTGDVYMLAQRVLKVNGESLLGVPAAMLRRSYGTVFANREDQAEIVWSSGDPYPIPPG